MAARPPGRCLAPRRWGGENAGGRGRGGGGDGGRRKWGRVGREGLLEGWAGMKRGWVGGGGGGGVVGGGGVDGGEEVGVGEEEMEMGSWGGGGIRRRRLRVGREGDALRALVVVFWVVSGALWMAWSDARLASWISLSELASSMSSPFCFKNVGCWRSRRGVEGEDENCEASPAGICFFRDEKENLGVDANWC